MEIKILIQVVVAITCIVAAVTLIMERSALRTSVSRSILVKGIRNIALLLLLLFFLVTFFGCGRKTYTMQKAYKNYYVDECPAYKKMYKSNPKRYR